MSTGPAHPGFSTQGWFTWWTRFTKIPRKSKVSMIVITVMTRYLFALYLLILRNTNPTDFHIYNRERYIYPEITIIFMSSQPTTGVIGSTT